MEKDRNVKNWIDYWKSSGGFFDRISDLEQAHSWNRRWSEPKNGIRKGLPPDRKRKRAEEIFGMLDEAGCRLKGARVLDIGCGPGAFSLAFAKAGATVTALDISKTALERLRYDAEKDGLSIDTIESSWWSVDIDKLGLRHKFDLAFVTSTPAVKDAACLDRMMNCSRNYCYYGFFIGQNGHGPRLHDDIVRNLLKKEPSRNTAGRGSMFMNAFMYLYLSGYRPLLRIIRNRRNAAMPWEEAADGAIRFLERDGTCTAVDKRKIREYYGRAALNGKYRARHDGYSGMMVWRVKR